MYFHNCFFFVAELILIPHFRNNPTLPLTIVSYIEDIVVSSLTCLRMKIFAKQVPSSDGTV